VIEVMIDCETLALGHEVPIVQIGACTMDMAKVFKVTVKPVGRSDPATLAWWKGKYPKKDAVSEDIALQALVTWLSGVKPNIYWANDPQQDCIWLESAFRRNDMLYPWKYNQWRSYRTIRSLAPVDLKLVPDHDALNDCIRQCKCLRASLFHISETVSMASHNKKEYLQS